MARLSTCQTGFTSVRSQYSSRFAIQFQFGRKWIPAVNFAAERKRRENVSRCNSVTETNLLILFAPPREKNLIKRKIPYSPWNYDERGGQGETRGGGEEKRMNNFYSEISWRTFLPRLILFDAFFSLFFSFLP